MRCSSMKSPLAELDLIPTVLHGALQCDRDLVIYHAVGASFEHEYFTKPTPGARTTARLDHISLADFLANHLHHVMGVEVQVLNCVGL